MRSLDTYLHLALSLLCSYTFPSIVLQLYKIGEKTIVWTISPPLFVMLTILWYLTWRSYERSREDI